MKDCLPASHPMPSYISGFSRCFKSLSVTFKFQFNSLIAPCFLLRLFFTEGGRGASYGLSSPLMSDGEIIMASVNFGIVFGFS